MLVASENRLHFGATLRLLRVTAGLSLRDLASRIGVSSAYLSRVENGHDASPTPDRLAAIAEVLDLPSVVLLELARQAGPAVMGYLERTPEAAALFLEIARRDLRAPDIARVKAFIDAELPDPVSRRQEPRLADHLTPARVIIGVSCSDFEELVGIAAARLGPEHDPARIVRLAIARERDAPSALGGGFAAPHAIAPGAAEAVVLVTLARKIPIDTPDGRPVRVAVLVVAGALHRAYLQILARVARLASYDVAAELCAAGTPEGALAIVERVESRW